MNYVKLLACQQPRGRSPPPTLSATFLHTMPPPEKYTPVMPGCFCGEGEMDGGGGYQPPPAFPGKEEPNSHCVCAAMLCCGGERGEDDGLFSSSSSHACIHLLLPFSLPHSSSLHCHVSISMPKTNCGWKKKRGAISGPITKYIHYILLSGSFFVTLCG